MKTFTQTYLGAKVRTRRSETYIGVGIWKMSITMSGPPGPIKESLKCFSCWMSSQVFVSCSLIFFFLQCRRGFISSLQWTDSGTSMFRFLNRHAGKGRRQEQRRHCVWRSASRFLGLGQSLSFSAVEMWQSCRHSIHHSGRVQNPRFSFHFLSVSFPLVLHVQLHISFIDQQTHCFSASCGPAFDQFSQPLLLWEWTRNRWKLCTSPFSNRKVLVFGKVLSFTSFHRTVIFSRSTAFYFCAFFSCMRDKLN